MSQKTWICGMQFVALAIGSTSLMAGCSVDDLITAMSNDDPAPTGDTATVAMETWRVPAVAPSTSPLAAAWERTTARPSRMFTAPAASAAIRKPATLPTTRSATVRRETPYESTTMFARYAARFAHRTSIKMATSTWPISRCSPTAWRDPM